jgi:hypothetical protein
MEGNIVVAKDDDDDDDSVFVAISRKLVSFSWGGVMYMGGMNPDSGMSASVSSHHRNI